MPKVVYLRIDDDAHAALTAAAQREGMTIQAAGKLAIQQWLDHLAKRSKPAHSLERDEFGMVEVPIRLSDLAWCRIRNYAGWVRCGSVDEAIRRLVAMGLRQAGRKPWFLEDVAD